MHSPEEALDYLEEQIPALSASAVTVAYWQTLAAGHSVLEVENDEIVEVFPDGKRRLIKKVEPGVTFPPGTRLELR